MSARPSVAMEQADREVELLLRVVLDEQAPSLEDEQSDEWPDDGQEERGHVGERGDGARLTLPQGFWGRVGAPSRVPAGGRVGNLIGGLLLIGGLAVVRPPG